MKELRAILLVVSGMVLTLVCDDSTAAEMLAFGRDELKVQG